jgi:eukaryotic-like serine/threonine-protein kinase
METPPCGLTVSELLDKAWKLDPAARETWLSELSRQDPTIAGSVRKLLEPQEQAAGHDAVGGPPSIALGGAAAGQHVGPYVLLRRLGTGGMGEVWLARRADRGLQREVALKLPLSNPLPWDLAARFSLERDILARLEHPSIARLYDAGMSAEGQPYLAMEVVHGEPITAFSDGRLLDVEARIALFNQVLAAVQFAHANLVLHRDLKPSNILVTAEGHIRLLDFGIAKLLVEDAPAPQGTVTEWAGRVLTPAYASPEQVLGQPLSTASDVYTLGVVLFELLTGKGPYRVELSSVAQLELAIVQGDPLRPSAAIDDDAAELRRTPRRRLGRQLAGDLDTVLSKALAKRPADRYGSAAALAEDLQRVLAREPVQARPPSTVYRASRFLGRHRWASLASGTAILALLGSTAVALRQAHRASVQGDLAQVQARNVSVVRDFLLDVLSAADPNKAGAKPPGEVTVQEAVDAAASGMGVALDTQPETKVPILITLSSVYSSLDQVDRSLALLEQALVAAEQSGPTPNRMEAEVLVHLAGTNMFASRSDAAARWLDRAETAFTALGDTESEVYAQALKMRGNLLGRGESPDLPRAIVVLERAAALFRKRYPQSQGRIGTLFYLAQTLRAENQPDRAETIADEAVALATELPRPGFQIPNAYSLRAAIRDSNGNLSGAEDDYRFARDGYARSVGPGHFLALQNDGLLGATVLERGQRREEALQLIESTTDALGRSRRGSKTHAQALNRLGVAYLRLGRFDRAAEILEQARAIWAERQETLQRTNATVSLSEARIAAGALTEGRGLLDEALAVLRSAPPSAVHPEGEVHLALGLLGVDAGKPGEARRELRQALALSATDSRDDLARRVLAGAALTRLALQEGDVEEALSVSKEVLQEAKAARLAQLPRSQGVAAQTRGMALCAAGRPTEGEPLLTRAQELLAAVVDPGSAPLIEVELLRARCLFDLGRRSEANVLAQQARRELVSLGSSGSPLSVLLGEVLGRTTPPSP